MLINFLQKEITLAIIVTVALVTLAIGIHLTAYYSMRSASAKVLSPLNSMDSIQNKIIESTVTTKTEKFSVLHREFLICGKIKNYYRGLGVSYYVNHFAFSICSIIFITLLTIAVFLIANKGWQNSSLILKSFLLTTIVISSIYYFLPNVLKNKENLNDNIKKVKAYGNIQSEILVLSNKINQVSNAEIDTVITHVYKKIAIDLDFITAIDDSKLGSEFSSLKSTGLK